MKTLLLRVTMAGVLFLGIMVLFQPAVVKAQGSCNPTYRCLPPSQHKLGFCESDCFCAYPSGVRIWDPVDCTPL
jgi:hypothetical protein